MSKLQHGKSRARWLLIAMGAAGVAPVIAACSADADGAATPVEATSEALSACPVSVTANAYAGDPDYWGTIEIENDGSSALKGVQISFDVPSGVTCDDDPEGWTHTQGGARCTYSRASRLSIAPGGSYTFHYSTDSAASFVASNIEISDPSCGTSGSPGVVWNRASLTEYTSYPDPGSDECINNNGCTWAGQFAALEGKRPESWVREHNIAAVHSKDFSRYKLKTLRLRKDGKEIDVTVYDMCADDDCNECCTTNAQPSGYLIDLEKYTAQRFGVPADGEVEWRCLDCD